MATYKHFEPQRINDICVVRLLDRTLFDMLAIRELEEELLSLINEESPRELIVDFGVVAQSSTADMSVMFRAKNRLTPKGAQLKLCGMQTAVDEGYERAKLKGTIFDIYDRPSDALGAAQGE